MTQPLVAVVTPVYNGEPHLKHTLRCVQAQTYPNLVHVVLDNASTDDTPEQIRAAEGGRVPIQAHRNDKLLPQVENWNAALALCPPEAKYVQFLAADDLIRSDAIEKLVEAAEADDEIDYVGAIDIFNGETKPHGLDPSVSIVSGRSFGADLMETKLQWVNAAHLFFRATPERLNAPFKQAWHPIQDRDFLVRDLLQRKVGFVFEPLYFTRYDEKTETAKFGGSTIFIYPNFKLLLDYGEQYFSAPRFNQVKRHQFAKLLRHLLYWRLTKKAKFAEPASTGLAERGMEPDWFDYCRAVLTWPTYKIPLLMQSATERPQKISEADFSATVAPQADSADIGALQGGRAPINVVQTDSQVASHT